MIGAILTEESISIRGDDFCLAGRLHLAAREAPLVVFVHGFAGSKDENGLFVAGAEYLAKRGFSTLRFDFTGCGESAGDLRDARMETLQRDLANVLRFAEREDICRGGVGLVGFSLGATIVARSNPPQDCALVYWSGVIHPRADIWWRYQTDRVLEQISARGYFAKADREVGGRLLRDLLNSDKSDHRKTWDRWILMLHGQDDEKVPIDHIVKWSKEFYHAEVVPIANADHSFKGSPAARIALFELTAKWLATRLIRASSRSKTVDHPIQSTEGPLTLDCGQFTPVAPIAAGSATSS